MHPVKMAEILSMMEPADRVHMSVSTDQNWLAYCISGETADKKSIGVSLEVQGNSQWVCNLRTGQTFLIAPNATSSWGGVWSPDRSYLAFFADINGKAQLWLWETANHELKLASDLVVRPFFGFEKPIWTSDSKHLIIKTMPSEPFEDNEYYNISVEGDSYQSQRFPSVFTTGLTHEGDINPPQRWYDRYLADICMINIATGSSLLLCSGLRPVGMNLSKDGGYLAFTSCLGEEKPNSQQILYDIWICPLPSRGDERNRCISREVRMTYGLSFAWGHDNHSIYYTTGDNRSHGSLWLADIYSNVPTLLYRSQNIDLANDYDPPKPLKNGMVAMISNGKLLCYHPDPRMVRECIISGRSVVAGLLASDQYELLVQTHEPKEALEGFWKVNLLTGETRKVLEEAKGHLPWHAGGAAYGRGNQEILAYFFQDAHQPPTLVVLDVGTNNRVIVPVNQIGTEPFGSSHMIRWNRGDQEIRGALLLPQQATNRVPVIMRVYGGSMQSKYVRSFGLSPNRYDNHQVFASNGFSVFLPDLPMEGTNEPADEITTAIVDALDALKKHPLIDPNRIGIIGHSFGGYSTLVAITRLKDFKAAVVSAGIGNLISFSTRFDIAHPDLNGAHGMVEDGQFQMGATYWEEPERYIRNSPFFDFHKIETPVLLVQGMKDQLCRSEAGPMFSALNRLDKEAQLVYYDEDHYQGTWRKKNVEDYYDRVVAWFQKYL